MKIIVCIMFCIFAITVVNAQPPGVTFDYVYPYKNGIPKSRFKERRDKILAKHSEKSLILSFAADIRNRQNDVDYEFRQNSNFWYLTGMPDPGAALLLIPGGTIYKGKKVHEILFVTPRSPDREVWVGTRLGLNEADSILGITTSEDISLLHTVLKTVLNNIDTLWLTGLPTVSFLPPILDKKTFAESEIKSFLHRDFPELWIKTSLPYLHELREIKDEDEIRLMTKAIEISMEGHKAVMQQAKAGMNEYEIEAIMEYTFKRLGAEDVGYPSIVGSEYNACILHYISNRKQTSNNDLILADCGAEFQNYTADITRTFPVNGKFTKEQAQIYAIVLDAQNAGIKACKKGNEFRAPHNAAMEVITKGLLELGIISSASQARWYFMHGTSHYLGLDVHDAGTFKELKKNSVITVEPGIYIPKGSPCDKRWWNIGIRIEDDILITDNEPINLSEALPRTIQEIEQLMKK